MRDAGLVEVGKEERIDHFIETYFRATAEMFHLSHGEGTSRAYMEQKAAETLQALSKVGLRVRTDPEVLSRLVELEKRMEEIGAKQDWSEKIASLDDVDFFVKQDIAHTGKLFSMSDKEFNEYLELVREQRRLWRSLVEEAPKVVTVARKR
jgi:hypothetical protein